MADEEKDIVEEKEDTPGRGKTSALKLTVVEAFNLPVPGRFNRQSQQGHLTAPEGGGPAVGAALLKEAVEACYRLPVPGLNPYAVVAYGDSRRSTRASRMDAWPRWSNKGNEFEFALDRGGATAERPLLQPGTDIVITIMNHDPFTEDALVGQYTLPYVQVEAVLARGQVGIADALSGVPLTDAGGLALCGTGSQPALLSLTLEIVEIELEAVAKDASAVPGTVPAHAENDRKPRSPDKLRVDTEAFFEKLNSSPIWRGRHGARNAHLALQLPDLPFEPRDARAPESLLCEAGVLEHHLELLKSFLARIDPPAHRPGEAGARKKAIWRELATLGVDRVSLTVMFGGGAAADDTVLQHSEFVAMLAREPAIARSIVQELAQPRVDVDALIVEAEEASKAVGILKKYKIMDAGYKLQARDPDVWKKSEKKLKQALEKNEMQSAATQADVDPFENDLFIHYKQLTNGLTDSARSRLPDTVLPGAETRPPAEVDGVRVDQVTGRQRSHFEGPPQGRPSARLLQHPRPSHDTQRPTVTPASIKSNVFITTTGSGSVDAGASDGKTRQSVHEFTHMGVRMLEAALHPGNWYTNSRTQPGAMAAFKRAPYWSPGQLKT